MTTLLQPEKDLGGWDPPSRDEEHELGNAHRALENILESLETTLPDVLTRLKDARWGGEVLCDSESLAVLAAQIEPLRTQLVAALDPGYKEIQDRLNPPRSGGDGPAWE